MNQYSEYSATLNKGLCKVPRKVSVNIRGANNRSTAEPRIYLGILFTHVNVNLD